MIYIDGSTGEGGGQIIRSSLALATVTAQPVTIDNIRARRSRPGLQRQHLTAVNAAAEVCQASLTGASLGSGRLTFKPQSIVAGEYVWDIGSAGSATLVLQTVLPALILAKGPSTVTIRGGTHNPYAPPVDFLRAGFLPQLHQMGADVSLNLNRYGFYPAGGGEVIAQIQPTRQLQPLVLNERGELVRSWASALVANLPRQIAQREIETIKQATHWQQRNYEIAEVAANGPGNVVMIELNFANVTELFIGFGQRGKSAERVATDVVKKMQAYLCSDAPVGPHLADQLLMPMGLGAHAGTGGGQFRCTEITEHTRTHAQLLERFLDVEIRMDAGDGDSHRVIVEHNRSAKT